MSTVRHCRSRACGKRQRRATSHPVSSEEHTGVSLDLRAAIVAGLLGMVLFSCESRVPQPRSTLVVNARVLDGTGAPFRSSSVRIEGENIVGVGTLVPSSGDTVIDAAGLTLAPGFIDTHSHADAEIFELPDALAAVRTGSRPFRSPTSLRVWRSPRRR